MKEQWKSLWPAAAGTAVFAGAVVWLLIASVAANEGHLVYPLDDTFIHMAVAENLAQHGTFGITPGTYTSVSSSPLYTLLLAGVYAVSGVWTAAPVVLNLLFGALALLVLNLWTRACGVRPVFGFVLILVVIHVTPLVTLAFVGMEHTLHVALTLALGALFVAALQSPSKRTSLALGAVALLAVATRYESMFLVGPMCVVFIVRRQWRVAVGVLVCSALPVLVYGTVSLAKGNFFLPNSLMFKGTFPPDMLDLGAWVTFLRDGLRSLAGAVHVFVLVCCAMATVALNTARQRAPGPYGWLCAVFAVAAAAHIRFARLGWFYRYEGYLLALGAAAVVLGVTVFAGSHTLHRLRGNPPFIAATCILLVSVFLPHHFRARQALAKAVPASRNIYEQQYQMGRFFDRQFPAGTSVAANDIGALTFLADIQCLDLVGLSNTRVLKLRRRGALVPENVEALFEAHKVRFVVVYTEWYRPGHNLPLHLIKAGTWKIPANVVSHSDTVTFFATTPEAHEELLAKLEAYADRLPDTVAQSLVHRPR